MFSVDAHARRSEHIVFPFPQLTSHICVCIITSVSKHHVLSSSVLHRFHSRIPV